ncbi:RagB/SusD family nutrient uptake outer membrane protein [Pedobacter sp. MC2016-05]|uniref:RagB/SusD family nutrient uptake outer membrane protein n=1 Tax=Pedobacter sp. MC2016-05 TaxID=2994474 RepID=UPI00224558FD|nr:RagB/SusD family nutrient uptake outer membrane protein [Pedobacter sp. MC2016-05]MCX2475872.1 RagB/SusD family nutrient uptake outer membrane protein [Pedobacter sp. MC2016-05]
MINKIYQKYILIFSLLVLTASSCKKLDLVPTDTISPDKAYRNISDINLGVLGAYALLDGSTIGVTSTVSDEATFPTENTVGNSDAFRWLYNAGSGSVTSQYYTFYVAIDRVNRTLAGLDALSLTGVDATTAARYRGELLALRAYFHFELLRNYASAYQTGALGVPYMQFSTISYPARDNFEVVIANAKADLIAAKPLIPTTFTDKTRITKAAVSAIQARLALYEKNWSEAIAYANEAIAAFPLATKAQFPGIWTDANDSEVIWKAKRVGTTDSRLGDFYFRQAGGIVLYAPAQKLINTFDKVNDLRYSAYIRFDATRTGTRSQYLVNKYIGGTSTAPGLTDIKLFRTGEMYLIKAEAEAESTGDAAGDLNALRNARINGYVSATFADKPTLIAAIMEERYKELSFEGHRFFDLKRRNLPVVRLAVDAANASGAVTLPTTQAQYSFPIPAAEISVNKQTIQNPNY